MSKNAPPRISPTPLGAHADAETRIQQLEEKLRRYADSKVFFLFSFFGSLTRETSS